MKKIFFLMTFTIILISTNLKAQGGMAAVPFLKMPQSTESLGTGWAGVTPVFDDAGNYYLNPAILGSTARKNNHLSFHFIPSETDWLGFGLGIEPNSYIFQTGYNFKEKFNFPISIGAGYIYHKFDFGEFIITNEKGQTIGTFDSWDKFSCFSLGINLDYLVSLSIGISYKDFESRLSDEPTNSEFESAIATGSAIDYGILMEISSEKLFANSSFFRYNSNNVKPTASFAFGYSLTNYGDEISYLDSDQADPLPRSARIGYSFNIGLDGIISNSEINIFNYTFLGEVSDQLIIPRTQNMLDINYDGIFGDINVIDNLISFDTKNNINTHRGHRFSFFDTFTYTIGRLNGPGWNNRKTSSYGVSTSGIFKLLSDNINNTELRFIFNHLNINYISSTLFEDDEMETDIDGLTIRFINFEL